jgi:predicted O-methyltransferase YrrM
VFIDADWDEQQQYFDWAIKLTRPKGCIYVDNAVRQLTESDEGDAGAWRLIDHVKGDDRVQATIMPTLAPYKSTLSAVVDGFVMAIKK